MPSWLRLGPNNEALQRQLAELTSRRGYKTSKVATSAQQRLLLTGFEQLGGEASPSEDDLHNVDRQLIAAANLGPLKEEPDGKKKKATKRKRPAERPSPKTEACRKHDFVGG